MTKIDLKDAEDYLVKKMQKEHDQEEGDARPCPSVGWIREAFAELRAREQSKREDEALALRRDD